MRCSVPLLVVMAASGFLPVDAADPAVDSYGGSLAVDAGATGRWRIARVGGRDRFVTPEGHGFYPLGVNHTAGGGAAAGVFVRDWNFNAVGYDNDRRLAAELPHLGTITVHYAGHYWPAPKFHYEDVFTAAFAERVEAAAESAARLANERTFAFALTDTVRWDLDIARRRRGTDWVSTIRGLGPDAAGKRAYVAFLKERYGNDFLKFRTAYRLPTPGSFDELPEYDFAGLELTRADVRADDEAFLGRIADRIFGLCRAAFERHAPGAIVGSERFKFGDHPDAVLVAAGRHADFIAVQAGPTNGPDVGQGPDESVFDAARFRRIAEVAGKPVLICDHAVSFATPETPRTLWHQLDDEAAAAEHYRDYLNDAAAEPYILGYFRCQYRSRYDPLRDLVKQGLLDLEGQPYETMTDAIRTANRSVLATVNETPAR